LCDYLGVGWEPDVVEYGSQDHGPLLSGMGDFAERIRAGRVLPDRPDPTTAEIPEDLRPFCRFLGYL
jgi:hypothetical protein